MTAVTGMKLSATQLTDLPGNKVPSGLNSIASKQAFKYRKCLNIRRTAPSKHFVKASDDPSSSDDDNSKSDDDEDDLNTSRTIRSQVSSFRPFQFPNPTFPTSQNPPSKSKEFPVAKHDSLKETESDENPEIAISITSRSHGFSAAKERQLLEDLIDYDEDEELRVNGMQTDDEAYLMWKSGDSRKTSKVGSDISSKRPKLSKGSNGSQLPRKDAKIEIICGWETIYNKKPIQKLKEDRKLRNQSNSNMYLSKYSTRNTTSNSFRFFHYTDIARYIQQYRSIHSCENPCSSHPGCCQEMSTFQEMRDLNFPFKFDLTTNSIRSKVASRGYQPPCRGGFEFEPPAGRNQPNDYNASYKAGNRGYISPVSFRPPYSLKSPNSENWNYLPESPSRLKYQLKKIWRSYDQKSSNEFESPPNNEGPGGVKQELLLCDLPATDDVTVKSIVGHYKHSDDANAKAETPHQLYSESGEQEKKEPGGMIARLRELKMNESCLHVREDKETRTLSLSQGKISNEFLPGDDSVKMYDTGSGSVNELKWCHEVDKTNRMRGLITTEIDNLQKKPLMSVEQKRKLNKFKEALTSMSNSEKPSEKQLSLVLPPSGSATKRFIAGSVRAYYTRTTISRNLIENVHTDAVNCAEDLNPDAQDDRPIIVVSQPHLRHVVNEPKKPDHANRSKKLIGGRTIERGAKHPADAKQFTRITDLLRIKERQQSGRRGFSGSARGTPIGSATTKNKSPTSERRSSAHKNKAKKLPEPNGTK